MRREKTQKGVIRKTLCYFGKCFAYNILDGAVAQRSEQSSYKRLVGGSTPPSPTIQNPIPMKPIRIPTVSVGTIVIIYMLIALHEWYHGRI